MERTYSQIDMDERRKIARWRTAGVNVDIIAEKLGRHRSTIFRELKRNRFIDAQIPDLNGYYCVTANDMARAWQKGSVENMNKRVRRYLPRDTDLLSLSHRCVRSICERLNTTPRKCLGYRTPTEVFREQLVEIVSLPE
ncbi:helix-turn-helix domain-containing protein [Phyllobacterium sp. 21LDTY02-6]|uniref:helix-turn-helix domain-containing protein n=1 Tax=Phyllobacterium sp. 21LDTY02-6 TaxID=2944903 RepID=UPI003531DA48